MAEIYINTSEYVFLKLFQAGVPTYADFDPVAVVTDGTGTSLGTHPVITESVGVYKILVTLADTNLEKTIKIVWTFTIFGQVATKTDIYSVITPYLSLTQIATKAPVGTSQDDLVMAEQFARFTIDQFTNQHFGIVSKTVEAYGQNTDVLLVPERILSVTKLYQNNQLVVDTGVPTATFPFNLEVTDTNWAIRIVPLDPLPIQEYTNGGVLNTPGNFRSTYRYKVVGFFGWASVPSDIALAALYLTADFFCQDNAWKTKYVQSMQATDWSIDFAEEAYNGSGNFVVDRILNNYKWNSMVVI